MDTRPKKTFPVLPPSPLIVSGQPWFFSLQVSPILDYFKSQYDPIYIFDMFQFFYFVPRRAATLFENVFQFFIFFLEVSPRVLRKCFSYFTFWCGKMFSKTFKWKMSTTSVTVSNWYMVNNWDVRLIPMPRLFHITWPFLIILTSYTITILKWPVTTLIQLFILFFAIGFLHKIS